MPDNMGSLLRGLRTGMDLGDRFQDTRRRRRQATWEQEDRERRRALEEELAQDRTERRNRQRGEDAAGEYGTTDEVEAALARMEGTPDAAMSPETGAIEAALRRRRAQIAPADQARQQAVIEGRAQQRGAEFGSVDEIEAELQRMAQIPDAEMSPEAGAIESALRQRAAQIRLMRERQAAGGHTPRETIDLDPETGEVMSRRVTRPFTGDVAPAPAPGLTPVPATGGGGDGADFSSPEALLEAVRAGKLSAAQAKAIATQRGWN